LPELFAEASIAALYFCQLVIMSLVRSLGLFAVALLLAACDKPNSDTAPVKQASPVESPQVEAVMPPKAVDVIEPTPEPVPTPETKEAEPAPAPPKPQPKPKPTPQPQPEHEPLELSLNPNVFDPLQPYEQLDVQPDKLLPPLFEEKPEPESPFQLNGKLITNDHIQGGYWDTVEGAQLNFEFKQ
jgi:outer membrane biosynthesis protein TonB